MSDVNWTVLLGRISDLIDATTVEQHETEKRWATATFGTEEYAQARAELTGLHGRGAGLYQAWRLVWEMSDPSRARTAS